MQFVAKGPEGFLQYSDFNGNASLYLLMLDAELTLEYMWEDTAISVLHLPLNDVGHAYSESYDHGVLKERDKRITAAQRWHWMNRLAKMLLVTSDKVHWDTVDKAYKIVQDLRIGAT